MRRFVCLRADQGPRSASQARVQGWVRAIGRGRADVARVRRGDPCLPSSYTYAELTTSRGIALLRCKRVQDWRAHVT